MVAWRSSPHSYRSPFQFMAREVSHMSNDDKNPTTSAEEVRDEAQEEQLRAQARGDNSTEIGAFFKEVAADHAQFPGDVAEDSKDPERRVDEEQGVPEHPSAEPDRDSANRA
jgi:hypothetical protein